MHIRTILLLLYQRAVYRRFLPDNRLFSSYNYEITTPYKMKILSFLHISGLIRARFFIDNNSDNLYNNSIIRAVFVTPEYER